MMMAVVIVALVLGALDCAIRRSRFLQVAEWHRDLAGNRVEFDHSVVYVSGSPKFGNIKLVSKSVHEWHSFLAVKYERSARYPWLPLEPDPPMPK
jgi:hypothetical protein